VSIVDLRVIVVRAFLDAHRRGEIAADAITDEDPPWCCFSIERRCVRGGAHDARSGRRMKVKGSAATFRGWDRSRSAPAGAQIASCELVLVGGGSERSVVAAICARGVAVDGGRRR
jgi:hypothetical protein